jgi:hypothetical protein
MSRDSISLNRNRAIQLLGPGLLKDHNFVQIKTQRKVNTRVIAEYVLSWQLALMNTYFIELNLSRKKDGGGGVGHNVSIW